MKLDRATENMIVNEFTHGQYIKLKTMLDRSPEKHQYLMGKQKGSSQKETKNKYQKSRVSFFSEREKSVS